MSVSRMQWRLQDISVRGGGPKGGRVGVTKYYAGASQKKLPQEKTWESELDAIQTILFSTRPLTDTHPFREVFLLTPT